MEDPMGILDPATSPTSEQTTSDFRPNLDSSADDETDLVEETHLEFEERIKQESAIKQILDQQGIIQFKQYAQEQHPKEPAKQAELIEQMQEQYFNYYMENVQRSQMMNQQRQLEQLFDLRNASPVNALSETGDTINANSASFNEPIPLPLIPASVWTRKDIAEFKKEILSTQRECCIKIGSLASATLRVPTHEEGSSIFWEFATDSYDLGFGVYFEWSLTPPDTITMTVSESSDEEDEEEVPVNESTEHPVSDSGVEGGPDGDLESGHRHSSGPPTDELIPIYRRDCHLEVYCGSHQYPGCGVYVFKFDNSFSLWRSKWLYYRVFYGK